MAKKNGAKSLLKATGVGVAVCGLALLAPIGLPTVILLTAAGAGASAAADNMLDED